MKILTIDPGTRRTGWVVYDTETAAPIVWGCGPWEDEWEAIWPCAIGPGLNRIGIEMIQSYGQGMAVASSVFDTCVLIGRIAERVEVEVGIKPQLIQRPKIKTHLCGTPRAKDSEVVAAIYSRYGGDRRAAVGVKASPGPLYGMKRDAFQALALAIYMAET